MSATTDAHRGTYDRLCAHAREIALLATTRELLEWDEQAKLPPAGGDYRAEQVSYLARLIHAKQTDPQMGQWLDELSGSPLAEDRHSDTGAVIANLKRDFEKQTRLPPSLVAELARLEVIGQQVWVTARRENDFAKFRPVLEQTVTLKKQEAEALGYDEVPYDALLDEHEPGETTANVSRVLGALGEELMQLTREIVASPRRARTDFLARRFPIPQQEALGRLAAAAIGFDFQGGRLDVSPHPFCAQPGARDVRLTTRYDEHDLCKSFFCVLHEAGHGIYDQGLPSDLFGLPTGEAVSHGIHESQSQLWEGLVGHSRGFWEHFYPQAQATFPDALADISLEEFYFAINGVEPSYLRIESDEVTYNLHIVIRFELELLLIQDNLVVGDLPAAWSEKYEHYLGVKPPNDADGVMQDIHWSGGGFGYFPTYALGNVYGAQFFDQARNELGDLDAMFRRGEFEPLRQWLSKQIYQHGRRYLAGELVERVTGQPPSHDAMIRHLRDRFGPLYELAS